MAMREWLESTGGKLAAAALLVLAAIAVFIAVRNVFGPPPEVRDANRRVFVDVQTGRPFTYELRIGDMIPVRAPSGGNTGYPAELCFWTRDGQVKQDPTAVVLNEEMGKSGPTFCPDCERLVRGHNPRPQSGDTPPPTKAEYRPRGGGRDEQ